MSYEFILEERDARIVTVTLNRPERRNALNDALLAELEDATQRAGRDDGVSVIIIRAAGPHFSAGRDIFDSGGDDDVAASEAFIQRINQHWLTLRTVPKPVITQVHGACMGLATQLCICSDITIVADDARIGVPVFPNDWMADWWVWRVGGTRAKLMAFTVGSSLTGTQAEEWGFATRSVPAADLEAETRKLADWIAMTPLQLLRLKKQAIDRAIDSQGFGQTAANSALYNTLIARSEALAPIQERRAEVGLQGLMEEYRPPE